jgi:hypothetical protein
MAGLVEIQACCIYACRLFIFQFNVHTDETKETDEMTDETMIDKTTADETMTKKTKQTNKQH